MKQFFVRTLPIAVAGMAFALAPAVHAAAASVDSVTGRVLIKRGDAYLPVDPSVALELTDSLVLVNGASVTVSCGGVPFATFNEAGVYSVPECPAAVAGNEADKNVNGGGASGTTQTSSATSSSASEPVPSKFARGVMTSGAIGVATVIVASAQGGSDDEKPASP